MMRPCLSVSAILFLASCSAVSGLGDDRAAPAHFTFFQKKVEPLLKKHCFECHSHQFEISGGLALDSKAGWQRGGHSGPAIVPGKPDESPLITAVRRTNPDRMMPPNAALSEEDVALLTEWVRQGAADPRLTETAAEDVWRQKLAERSSWWSLQPPKENQPPVVDDPAWQQEPVDRFIRAKLAQSGLRPAPPADPQVLIRRLSFVLTGLPPAAHATLSAGDSYESTVDRLLASQHFGERIARHWMDVVRYTDTYGYEWDMAAKGSWEYRDYLIRAFNDDIGFDQLIREQVAGDLLPQPRINRQERLNESLIGPMFYHLGEHRHGSSLAFNGIHQEMIDNKIDAFSKAFLGMTVACARCHDHKLDAISQADYYALAGVFMTPRWTTRVIDAPGKNDAAIAKLKRLRDEIRARLAIAWKESAKNWQAEALKQWALANQDTLQKAKIDDVAYPLAVLAAAVPAAAEPPLASATADAAVAEAWRRLAAEWRTTRDARLQHNTQFTVLTDFATPGFPANWIVEGDGIAHGHVADGTPRVSLEGDSLLACLLPRGYHTHALSSKLPGAVRPPAPEQFPQPVVSLRVTGGEWAAKIVVPQNAFLNEGHGGPSFFDSTTGLQWSPITQTPRKNGVTRVLTEFTTAALNPNFPPRTGLARAGKTTLPSDDDGFDKRSWLSLTGIVTHSKGGAPQEELAAFAPLYETAAPDTVSEAWQSLSAWLTGAVDRWASGTSTGGDVPLLNWMLAERFLPNDAATLPDVAALVEQYRQIEASIPFPRTANSMDERGVGPINYRLNERGNVDDEGPAIDRGFLEVFAGKHAVGAATGSGRLELAEYLASRDNPQTARVYVNRIWQWVFGAGLVHTPSDFGKLGDQPSHPELLDWLTRCFIEEGWSTKKLIRRLVLSQTFRQSGQAEAIALDRDPANRLLHHYPTRRLEAEAIRDSLLVVSGRLDPQLYGRPIRPWRTAEDPAKRLYSGPLDGLGRRSIYIEMSIMAPPTFLVGFNLPSIKLPTGRRDVTNVPTQALLLLNDPFVNAMAERWAAGLINDGSTSAAQRVGSMFQTAFGRQPNDDELATWLAAAASFAHSDDLMTDQGVWTALAHALVNAKEFLYYR